jgi:hypothetical protein
MNLMFWKKKKVPEESDHSTRDGSIVATGSEPTPAKPGFLTRLKSALTPSRKKCEPDEEAATVPIRKDGKHQGKEYEALPAKPGFLARLKNKLMPSHKEKTDNAEKPERKPSTERTDRKHLDEEQGPTDTAAEKPRKRLAIALALLIPLAAGGGFFAATKLVPPHQDAPLAKDSTSQEIKIDGQPESEQTEAAGQEELQQTDDAAPPIEETPETTEEPVADTPADEDVQTQIEVLKKQNKEMQAQIEELRKLPVAGKSTRPTPSNLPREGVLIINGKNTKESVQGLKKIIDDMNGTSGAKDTGKEQAPP